MHQKITSLFENAESAKSAILALNKRGFARSDIGIASQNSYEQQDILHSTEAHLLQGLIARSISEGMIGRATRWLLGTDFLSLSLGISKEEASYFDDHFRAGGVFVVVIHNHRCLEAFHLLQTYGAEIFPKDTRQVRSQEQPCGT
jgi:hypothetical protein